MRTIVLIMLHQPIAQGLIGKLHDVSGVRLFHESDYSKAEDAVFFNNADVVLLEVPETGAYDVAYCLALCDRLRASNCRLLLMCPEQDEASVSSVVNAKQKEQIDDFVFYDASFDYVASKLLTI